MAAARTMRPRGYPGLRILAAVSVASVGVVVLSVIGALIWTSTVLRGYTETSVRDARSIAIVHDLRLSMLDHQRISNLAVLTQEPELHARRGEVLKEIHQFLRDADTHAGSAAERELLAQAREQLATYMARREQLEAQGLELDAIIEGSRAPFRQVIDSVAGLQAANERQVQEAQNRAQGVAAMSHAVALGIGLALVVGVIVILYGVRRYVLRPTLGLHETILRFQAGDASARAAIDGSYEAASLARAFNEMAAALGHQREHQLAFLAGVAHDLRNPLAAMKMGLHLLQEPSSTGRELRTVEMLHRQVDRLGRMVGDLLDATRIEAGHLELQPRPLNLCEVVEEVVRLYAPTSPDHPIQVDTARPVMIRGDALRIEQVVSNLVSNAIKFSPAQSTIDVSVDAIGDKACLAVRDHGVGISPDDRLTLFAPFRRHRPDVAPGAGLGLSVVRRIVLAHGGTIDVDSEPGIGSTFRVQLPLQHEERDPKPDGATQPSQPVSLA